MEEDVKKAVAERIQLAERIVKGKSNPSHAPRVKGAPDGAEIGDISNGAIFNDGGAVVKIKSTAEGAGVNRKTEEKKEKRYPESAEER